MNPTHAPVFTCLGLLIGLTGCPDPDVEFADFNKRYEDIHGPNTGTMTNVGGGCAAPAAGEIDGDFFFALVPKQSPKKPAPFHATVTTSDAAGGLEYSITLQPIDAEDRVTEVGPPLPTLGPFPVGADGSFDSDWGTLIVPGETNPISASELTVEVQINGQMCPGDFFCGGANGMVTMPINLPIDGSSWAMERLSLFAEPPKLNCAGDVADPI
jgi:hypothetical protein